ncbi:MAG: TMEM175 family protein [Pseudoxanthomonas sp.]|nr:TMEM175 family protein [Pseudoxanthomonas sp.]
MRHRHADADADVLPDGFRHRGREMTRLEAFVDAAFAFAVTLLVISIDAIPDSIDGLVDALKGIPAFATSFAMVALFWSAHARWSRRYGLDDATTTVLSLVLVFLVLIYVYPLKLLFGSFFASITGGWLPWPLARISSYDDIRFMFAVYALAFATLSLVLMALYGHAWRRRALLGLSIDEQALTAGHVAIFALFVAVGLLSLLASALVPERPSHWLGSLPGWLYFLLFLTGPAEAWARRRVLRRAGLP